jgi:hypothetical protein
MCSVVCRINSSSGSINTSHVRVLRVDVGRYVFEEAVDCTETADHSTNPR